MKITDNEIKKIEKNLNYHGIIMFEAVQYLRQFSINDIVNLRSIGYDRHKGGSYAEKTYYYYNNAVTNVEKKYRVVYVDTNGLPHISLIEPDGKKSCIIEVITEIEEMAYDDGFFDRKIKIQDIIAHDPDFIDAAILQDGSYRPLALYEEEQKNKDKELKAKVEKYYSLKEHNRKLRMYTGSKKGVAAFIKNVNVGDEIYEAYLGEIKSKLKQDGILVFERDKRAIAMSTDELKERVFYSQKPIDIEFMDKNILAKFKPKK